MSIYHRVIGEGFPVVILHGWTLDHQVMLQTLEPVFRKRNGWRRIYIDLPGMGRSRPQESIQNSDDMVTAILALLDELLPNEPFALCGYSYGAMVARGITHFRQDLVRGLLLYAFGTIPDHTKRTVPEKRVLRTDPILMSQLSAQEAVEFESMAVIQGQREWERFHEEILIPSGNANHDFLNRIRDNGYGFTFDTHADSSPFERPVLMIAGRQDHVAGFQDAWRLMDQYPRATFAVLDMAGHNLQFERPEVFEALMSDWLERVEGRI